MRSTVNVFVAALMVAAANRALAQTTPMKVAAASAPAVAASENAGSSRGANDSSPSVQRVEISTAKELDDRQSALVARQVVTHGDIERFGDSSIADVLRRVPGVSVSTTADHVGEIRMRGLGNGYTQILLNGEPTPPGFSVESLSPSLIERIEVSRVATADVSTQAIAGTINIILKEVVRKGQRQVKGTFGGYPGNPYFALDSQLSDRSGKFSYTLAGTASRDRETWPSSFVQRGYDAEGASTLVRRTDKLETGEIETLSIAPRLNWTLDDGAKITSDTLARFKRTEAGVVDERDSLFGEAPLYASDDLHLRLKAGSLRTRLSYGHDLADGSHLDGRLGYTYNHRTSDARFFGFDASGGNVLDEHTTSPETDQSITSGGKYKLAPIGDHAPSLGWDLEGNERDEDRIQRQTAPQGYPAANLDEYYKARVQRVAAFVQDEWEMSKQLSTYLGVRWEGLDTHSAGNNFDAVDSRSSVVSPIVQSVWKVPETKSDQVRFGLSRTYKAPATKDLMPRRYVANDNTPTTPDLQGNPSLRPELAWGVDLAYERYLPGDGIMTLSASGRHLQNVILQQLSNVGGVWISSPANQGEADVRSLEFELKTNVNGWSKSAPDIALHLDLTRNWSSVRSVSGPDNRLAAQTPFTANVGADLNLKSVPLTMGANLTWTTGFDSRISNTQSIRNGPKRQLDAFGLWRFDKSTSIRLSVMNVLKKSELSQQDYFDASSTFDQFTNSPTIRSYRLAVETKF